MEKDLDVVIVGAGPSGLACAIAARRAGLAYEVLEKGALVNSLFHYPRQMTFFTTPELLEIGELPFVTPYEKPTLPEALKYYRRVCDAYDLNVTLGARVNAIVPDAGRFRIEVEGGPPRRARTVAMAIGYYDNPNRLGVPGEDLPHVSHYYSDPHAYYRRRVLIVGAKNSAAIAALEIHRAGGRVTLVHRGERLSDSIKYWIRPDIENRIKEGSVAVRYRTRVAAIEPGLVRVEGPDGPATIEADSVLLLIGYHPDVELLRAAGVHVHPETLVPEHDPASLETNVPDLYLVGAVASGRETNRIFIENGRFHGEAVIAAIVARRSAGAAAG
jgi:thioredoxin reductase (NADPH)